MKTKRKHEHFVSEMDKIVGGCRENEFEKHLVDIVAKKSLDAMTNDEKELINSV
jgi:hypothetical protein